MAGLKRIAILIALALLAWPSQAAPAEVRPDRPIVEILLDNHRVINVIDDFLAYWDAARGRSLREKRRLWMEMVEARHFDYFDRAVYRGADVERRLEILDDFLARVPEHIETIREFNKTFTDPRTSPLVEAIIHFRSRFPEYRHMRDVYIGLSMFRFDGSVRPVQNEAGIPDTLCLGADVLAGYTQEQVRMAIIHEFFHLYHFRFLFRQPLTTQFRTPHMPLMIEGMAVAGTEEVYPSQPLAKYLHFSDQELATQQKELGHNSRQFLELIKENAPVEEYERWFSNAGGDETPPRGGYLLGFEITRRVRAAFSLEQMVRMTPDQLREHAEEQLAALASDQIILLTEVRSRGKSEAASSVR
jgi:hypothetical protein